MDGQNAVPPSVLAGLDENGYVPGSIESIEGRNPNLNQTPPNPTLKPQTGALTPPDIQDERGVSALAGGPTMAQQIARNQITAAKVNNGSSRDWAENTVAAITTALAGVGAVGKVPPGAGALYGAGKAAAAIQDQRNQRARQAKDDAYKQQTLDLEKQRLSDEEKNTDFDHQQKLAENARQQAMDVRAMQEHDARMQAMNDEHNRSNFELMKEDVDFRQAEVDREQALKDAGAEPLKVGGKEAPEFDDLGQAEQYAKANGLGTNAHENGYRTRIVLGADHKYQLYEVPDSGPEWHTIKDADGKDLKIWTDPLGLLNAQERIAQTREANARSTLDYRESEKQLRELDEEGTVKKAREDLSKVGGDYSKLDAGDREALTTDAQKRYSLTFNAYQAAQRDMEHDADYSAIPTDANGRVDTTSEQYKDLASRYHVDDAEEQLGQAYDNLRQLGHGYQKPGAAAAAAAPAVADAKTPEGAVDALRKQKAADTAKANESQQKEADLDALHAAITKTVPQSRGRQGTVQVANPQYNADLAGLIASHPEWTDDEKIRAMKRFGGGGQSSTNEPARPANVPAGYVYNANGPKGAGWYRPQ